MVSFPEEHRKAQNLNFHGFVCFFFFWSSLGEILYQLGCHHQDPLAVRGPRARGTLGSAVLSLVIYGAAYMSVLVRGESIASALKSVGVEQRRSFHLPPWPCFADTPGSRRLRLRFPQGVSGPFAPTWAAPGQT